MEKLACGILGFLERILVKSKSIISLKSSASRARRRLGKNRKRIRSTRKEIEAQIGRLSRDLEAVQAELKNPARNAWVRIHVKKYPAVESAESLVRKYAGGEQGASKTLDLGCGANIRNPFGASDVYGVDVRGDLPSNISKANLSSEAIPFPNDFFDFCTAFDVLEHIPRISWPMGKERSSFVELMNEIHRILRPGGLFLHSTPAYPSKEAFQDPTHVNIITEDTIPLYFCERHDWAKILGYGFNGRFELLEQAWVNDIWLVGILRAQK